MHEFIAKHHDKITGTLSGFDRLVFRGTLRSIAHEEGMRRSLWANQVLLKDFGSHLERVSGRKCLFLYHYGLHPVFGFMNARIQTWFPVPVQLCLNGREWLARQMDAAGLEYARQDNCFPWIADWGKAQRLRDRQLRAHWPKLLDGVAKQLNPAHREIFQKHPVSYYGSTDQREWAIALVFRAAADLRRRYPRLVHPGMTTFASPDVRRYLGKRIPLRGDVPPRFAGEVGSDRKRRSAGVRIQPGVNGNSLKLDDKAFTGVGSVLRAEATVHNGDDFRVYRPKEGDPAGELAWRQMRRGIADLHRRAEGSPKAAERYLDAFASVAEDTTLEELIRRLGPPKQWRGRRVRALRPFADDRPLLEAVRGGEFAIHGFRNRERQAIRFPRLAKSPEEARRRSAWVSRTLRLLRAHGLITKITGTHRYPLTVSGRKTSTAILTALRSTVRQLTTIAA